ncbi:MAG: ABC transporter ATP-binding protein, partial [Paludibacteraceae bacterium]|nr:ABC transporter ATP-binding protein [Paludibacteraceae bacterium]
MERKDIVVKFENVGKQYRLGVVGTGTLSHDLNRWFQTSVLRKEDPYLKVGESNDRTKKGLSDYVWALRDINFEVEKGDVLGIVGRNGAGKSTLLKLLSNVTVPTVGEIKIKGRIASLLEVGTGFHPELTGRENIFMNGSIMGMTKKEIKRKLDEIVDFAGVERYLDTPTKRYSSGMTVRLGFAIAAFLEPEILVVDEVLAVGDAEFQKKAIGKMQDVAKGEGRTVLFVSHNMASVKSLCNKGVILQNGTVAETGDIEYIVGRYLDSLSDESGVDLYDRKQREGTNDAKFVKIETISSGKASNTVVMGKDVKFRVEVESKCAFEDVDLYLGVYTGTGIQVLNSNIYYTTGVKGSLEKGLNVFESSFETFPLQRGVYYI